MRLAQTGLQLAGRGITYDVERMANAKEHSLGLVDEGSLRMCCGA